MHKLKTLLAAASLALLAACTGIPDGVKAVDDFELEQYLGTWYEVARLDHRFERGLSNVTANYSLRDDGGVAVVNRGYRGDTGEWDEANGKAYFVDAPNVGRLKVSFFGPFYGGYNVVAVDPARYSLVVGPDRSYLWILSRTPSLEDAVLTELVARAERLGFATDELIYVEHDRPE
ncbi:MAG: lipocalin family protein [Gammaproteobacteria bacterium]|nr:lipocalin family protein [Gammaproteobacteria bacterium]